VDVERAQQRASAAADLALVAALDRQHLRLREAR
jgi:hypothetical protein